MVILAQLFSLVLTIAYQTIYKYYIYDQTSIRPTYSMKVLNLIKIVAMHSLM